MTMQALLSTSPEADAALREGRPVVALESTIIAHGMPWPRNAQTAFILEDEVRAHGAVPATIAVIDGRLKVGLTRGEIERLACDPEHVAKASRRDLALLVARRGTGATTVAATMIVAALAGIRVFATGGIGGVHRGGASSFDISADLTELARTPVAVVCAGAKAILDLGLTLEFLETHGVPVLGYGTDSFPAFWSRDSGLPVDARVDDPHDIARAMQAQWALGLSAGFVVANPIAPAHEMPRERIELAITEAVAEAEVRGIRGKAITPFLLERVNATTGGDSLDSNVELVRGNARLAARIAVAYASLR